jgi:predicted DNA-binding mobile mystery protein A
MVSVALAARQLDRKMMLLKRLRSMTPRLGWLRTIRQAIGMSQGDVASRLGVAQSSVDGFERAEARGAITLASLRRVADAMDCDLAYALVPRRGLEAMIRDRAQAQAEEIVRRTSHSMQMEAQGVGARESRRQIEELARELAAKPPRGFWKVRT